MLAIAQLSTPQGPASQTAAPAQTASPPLPAPLPGSPPPEDIAPSHLDETLATVSGVATDPSGALLPFATVHLTGPGPEQTVTADSGAHFSVQVPPGAWELTVDAPGFASYRRRVQLRARQRLALTAALPIAVHAEELSVPEDADNGGADPSANRDALVFRGEKLATLSDDTSTLQRQLVAMTGGSEPGSAQFFIDGFSGGRFPPKETIREIRINQNPFSAQYDRRGFGRIDVFTKPGSNKLHGSLRVSGNTDGFNAPNPYAGAQLPYHSQTIDGDINGSIGRQTSFFLAVATADNQSNIPVNAVLLDSSLQPFSFSQTVQNPQASRTYSVRLDQGLGARDTLTTRYEYNNNHLTNGGVGQLTLLSQGFSSNVTTQTLQLGNTLVPNAHLVNETRFQYIRTRLLQAANDTSPSLIVQGSFNGGGSPAQSLRDNQDSFEFQEYLSLDRGKHFFRLGARYRLFRDANVSTANYNGQYIFPTLAAYQTTLRGLQQGLTPAAIRALGGGATQFNLTAGTPAATVLVGDLGAYAEDEWKVRPDLAFTLGARFETQSGIPDHFDPAPRAAVTWSIGNRKGEPSLLVLRAGAGLFYDRFAPGNILQTRRQNGVSQRPYYIERPDFFPAIPTPSSLSSTDPTTYLIDPRFRSLYTLTTQVTVDHTWSKRGSVSVGFNHLHGVRLPLSLNINAPLPGTYNPAVPGSGTRPLGGTRAVYQYTAEGFNDANSIFSNGDLKLFQRLTVWGFYTTQWRTTNVSGANSFPSNQYNLRADIGPSNYRLRQRLYVGAEADLPWGINSGLFLGAHSGPPFNITIGQDINGDTQFNDRPAFATDLNRPSVVRTAFGNFDTAPLPSQSIIPINYGNSPAYTSVTAQVGKIFQIGPRTAPAAGQKAGAKGARRDQLGFSVEASNLLNTNNAAQPVGVLSSPFFGRSIGLNNEDIENTAANRFIRLYAFLRF